MITLPIPTPALAWALHSTHYRTLSSRWEHDSEESPEPILRREERAPIGPRVEAASCGEMVLVKQPHGVCARDYRATACWLAKDVKEREEEARLLL